MTDTLPAEVHYLGNLWASAGSYGYAGGVITWTGTVPAGAPVTISYGASVDAGIATPRLIVNNALIDDGMDTVWTRQAAVIANGRAVYLPLALRR